MSLVRAVVLAGLIAANFGAAAGAASTTTRLTAFEKCTKTAQRDFDRGLYKQAETQWGRALAVAAQSQAKDDALEVTLKRLGETLLKEGRYEDAQRCLGHAVQINELMAFEDAELAGDLAMLSQTYKPLDVSQLGKFAADLLTEANLTSIGLVRTDSGNRVQLEFPSSFNKHIDDKDVEGVGVDRIVSFNITESPDGSVKIDHIKGFRVHAKYWVNIIESEIKPNAGGVHPADVTAQKMGVVKTVHARLSNDQYAPVAGLLAQLTWTDGSPVSEDNSTASKSDSGSTATSTSSSTDASTATTSTVSSNNGTGGTASTVSSNNAIGGTSSTPTASSTYGPGGSPAASNAAPVGTTGSAPVQTNTKP